MLTCTPDTQRPCLSQLVHRSTKILFLISHTDQLKNLSLTKLCTLKILSLTTSAQIHEDLVSNTVFIIRDTTFIIYYMDQWRPCLFHVTRSREAVSLRWYTTQNLLRITFLFNDLMLKTIRLKKDLFYKDRLIFGLDDPVANMSIRHVYYA